MKKKCLVIGDLNVDLIFFGLKKELRIGSEVKTKGHYFDIGGSGGIFASVLSQLGIETSIHSILGSDQFGKRILEKLDNMKVKTDLISKSKRACTGITVNIPYSTEKYQISSLDIFSELIKEKSKRVEKLINQNFFQHIHFTSYYMMRSFNNNYKEYIKKVTSANKKISFSLDVNDDPKDSWNKDIFEVLNDIDILFLNEKESLKISNEKNAQKAVEKLSKHVKTIVVKLGEKGFIAKKDGIVFKEKALKTVSLDSTGAGDNFDAGYIYGLLNNLSPIKCLRIANIMGSRSVEYIGGVNEASKYLRIKKEVKSLIS